MLAWITKLLPFLQGIFGKLGEAETEAAKTRAKVELEEAKAFRQGRYAPRYVLKYCMIGIFCLFCILLMVGTFFPYAVDLHHPIETIERLAKVLFSIGWD